MGLFKKVTYSAAVTFFFKSHPLFVTLFTTVYCFIFSKCWYILLSFCASYVNMAFFVYFSADSEM